jgi:hypothetical protein
MMHIATALFAVYFVDKRLALLISYSINLQCLLGNLENLLFFNCAVSTRSQLK